MTSWSGPAAEMEARKESALWLPFMCFFFYFFYFIFLTDIVSCLGLCSSTETVIPLTRPKKNVCNVKMAQ